MCQCGGVAWCSQVQPAGWQRNQRPREGLTPHQGPCLGVDRRGICLGPRELIDMITRLLIARVHTCPMPRAPRGLRTDLPTPVCQVVNQSGRGVLINIFFNAQCSQCVKYFIGK